jgi:hypothetical protein
MYKYAENVYAPLVMVSIGARKKDTCRPDSLLKWFD